MSDLGSKYECSNCSAKFYDLRKPEPVCPKCGTNQNEEANEGDSASETGPKAVAKKNKKNKKNKKK